MNNVRSIGKNGWDPDQLQVTLPPISPAYIIYKE